MTKAKALATLDTSPQKLEALHPEEVCRPRTHLKLASDQACGPQTLLETSLGFLFRESERDARCEGVVHAVIHANIPRVLDSGLGQSSTFVSRSEYDGLNRQDDAGGGCGTYRDARAKKRLVLMILDDLAGCCRLQPPGVEIKLGQAFKVI